MLWVWGLLGCWLVLEACFYVHQRSVVRNIERENARVTTQNHKVKYWGPSFCPGLGLPHVDPSRQFRSKAETLVRVCRLIKGTPAYTCRFPLARELREFVSGCPDPEIASRI
jgi:hypothetical protein